MLLVPRQLRRAGLTGDVPYYGGRFTPAQAYAASHPVAASRSGAAAERLAGYGPWSRRPPSRPGARRTPSARSSDCATRA